MSNTIVKKSEKRNRRHKRIRSKVSGTALRPRLSIFRSNRAIYAQLIDDDAHVTLLSVQTDDSKKKTLTDRAQEAGKRLAEKAKEKGIQAIVFDRGGFIYTGNIRSFAEAVREGGLSF